MDETILSDKTRTITDTANNDDPGRLGVLTPGMGAIATTFFGGILAIRQGLGQPIGALSQMATLSLDQAPGETQTRIRTVLPLARMENLVFGGWDIFADDMTLGSAGAGPIVLQVDEIAVTTEDHDLHPGLRHLQSGGEGDGPAVGGVEGVDPHVARDPARAADTGDDRQIVGIDPRS